MKAELSALIGLEFSVESVAISITVAIVIIPIVVAVPIAIVTPLAAIRIVPAMRLGVATVPLGIQF